MPPRFLTPCWPALVVVIVAGALDTDDPDQPKSESLPPPYVPPGVLVAIGACALPGPNRVSFGLICQQAHDDLRGMLRADRIYRRLLLCLSDSGQHDGAWLPTPLADALDALRIPPIPADFPPPLMAFIEDELKQVPATAPSAFVDRIRARYPPPLRGLFPHNRLVATALLQRRYVSSYFGSPYIIAQLHAFGIVFPRSTMRIGADGEGRRAAFRPYTYAGEKAPHPCRLMDLLHRCGLDASLVDLLQNPLYLQQNADPDHGLTTGLSLLIPTIGVDLFRRIVHLPTVRPLVDDPQYHREYDSGLMFNAIRAGRIDDLAAVLVGETDTVCPRHSVTSLGAIAFLPKTPSAVRAYVALCQYARFRAVFEADLDHFFERVLTLVTADTLPDLLRAGDAVAELLARGRSATTGRTFLHALFAANRFDLIRVVLAHGAADPRTPDNANRTAIAYLPGWRVREFVEAALPEPKRAALARFPRADLVRPLLRGVVRDRRLDGYDAVVRLLYGGDRRAALSDLGWVVVWRAHRLKLERWWRAQCRDLGWHLPWLSASCLA